MGKSTLILSESNSAVLAREKNSRLLTFTILYRCLLQDEMCQLCLHNCALLSELLWGS